MLTDHVHTADLPKIATKAGESGQAVIAKIQALGLANDKGLVSFEGFLTVRHLFANEPFFSPQQRVRVLIFTRQVLLIFSFPW